MNRFLHGHATHADWRVALALAAAQIEAQRHTPGHAATPTLGWVYLTDALAPHAEALLGELRQRWPGVEWVGATGVGIAAAGVEYFDAPALALMLTDLAPARFRVFSGARPLTGFAAHTANVHADPSAADLAELIHDMSARTATGYLFGGLASAPSRPLHIAGNALAGGLSGVAFDRGVALVSRVTQGCQPVGPQRTVTAAERNVVIALDGEPALDCLLRDIDLSGVDLRSALPRLREVLVGLSDAGDAAEALAPREDASTRSAFDAIARHRSTARAFGADTRVRHLVGLDPARRAIAIADSAEPGVRLAFCARHVEAARRDLMRICAEVREEVETEELPQRSALALKGVPGADAGSATASGIAGAIYVSCSGRGGAHFGAPSAELGIVRHALGDVPLVGFFAAGEIARRHLYGYTGVLTVFRRGGDAA
ncbi:MAG TPA: FIST N-terminal domain-containing protein [Burkholderiaceae bacterium]|nr:FIST N-terminal domain-containing protein [Burkholderiaceae bacterium]